MKLTIDLDLPSTWDDESLGERLEEVMNDELDKFLRTEVKKAIAAEGDRLRQYATDRVIKAMREEEARS